MRTNRLMLEYKQTTDNGIKCKWFAVRKLFNRHYYLNYHQQRCTSLKDAMLYINNKGVDNVITAIWFSKEGLRWSLRKKGKWIGAVRKQMKVMNVK